MNLRRKKGGRGGRPSAHSRPVFGTLADGDGHTPSRLHQISDPNSFRCYAALRTAAATPNSAAPAITIAASSGIPVKAPPTRRASVSGTTIAGVAVAGARVAVSSLGVRAIDTAAEAATSAITATTSTVPRRIDLTSSLPPLTPASRGVPRG